MQVSDFANWSGIASAHAGSPEHAHRSWILARLERRKQRLRTLELAGDRIADPDRGRRGRGLAFLHHIEMRIKGRDLVDRGLRQAHFVTQCAQVAG